MTNERVTVDEVMRLAQYYTDLAYSYVIPGAGKPPAAKAKDALRTAVEALVSERDALRTERDTLRQVIEQQLLNVPVGERKK